MPRPAHAVRSLAIAVTCVRTHARNIATWSPCLIRDAYHAMASCCHKRCNTDAVRTSFDTRLP